MRERLADAKAAAERSRGPSPLDAMLRDVLGRLRKTGPPVNITSGIDRNGQLRIG